MIVHDSDHHYYTITKNLSSFFQTKKEKPEQTKFLSIGKSRRRRRGRGRRQFMYKWLENEESLGR